MKNGTAIICLAAVSIVAFGLITTCDNNPLTPREIDFGIHEWGVMVGCTADTSYFLTSRPEMVPEVDIPVIYVHSKHKMPFTAQVTFNSGGPTDTYPEAEVDSNTVLWEDVSFVVDIDSTADKVPGDYEPLENIINVLNYADADWLEYDSQITRFLFYEGNVSFENNIQATYDFDAQQATLKNNNAYPVFNAMVAAYRFRDSVGMPDIHVGKVRQLNPGTQVTVAFSQQTEVDLTRDLVSQGFTQKESQAFDVLWRGPFLYPSLTTGARANLIYRLPQNEYDKLITLDIDPQPDRIIRSLYMLVHLDPSSNLTDFEVHEWGVMVGCMTDTSFFLTSRPEQISLVREPVIYIHSRDKTPFTAEVTFNSGRPTDTYPEAEVNNNTVLWEDVAFALTLTPQGTRGTDDFVPLDSIIDILNDVDADCLEYNDQTARFLFYEGEVPFENEIKATYNFSNQQATFVNEGAYPVYNVMVVASAYVGRIDQLNPGDSIVVSFSDQTQVDLVTDLVSEGFTIQEAQAFAKLWEEPFFHSASPGLDSHIIYRLPRNEYDNLITLSIDPQPDKTIRSLYILVHLFK
jgi:hypothetical protein